MCQCDWCQRISPGISQIKSKLNDEENKLFDEIVDNMIGAETDAACYKSQLQGLWPGWEGFDKVVKDFHAKKPLDTIP